MELLFLTNILYTCRVHNAGYRLDGVDQILRPKYKSHLNPKPFSYEALLDFLSIPFGKDKNNDSDSEARLRFCNKWGCLQRLGENSASFRRLVIEFQNDLNNKTEVSLPPFKFTLDFEWSATADGNLLPIIRSPTLFHAIRSTHLLLNDLKVNMRECKRPGCFKLFEAKRSNQVFCSISCKNKQTSYTSRKRKIYEKV